MRPYFAFFKNKEKTGKPVLNSLPEKRKKSSRWETLAKKGSIFYTQRVFLSENIGVF